MKLLLGSFVDERGGSSSPFERSISLSSLWPSVSTAWKLQNISEHEKIRNIFRAVYLLRTARKRKRVLVVLIWYYIACLHLHNNSWFTAHAHKGTHNDVIMRSMDEENMIQQ